MNYWLLKTEPDCWSWENQESAPRKTTHWDGIRNHQANNHLKAMRKGDLCFFYLTGDRKQVEGVVEVVGEWEPDPSNETEFDFGMVHVRKVAAAPQPVTLKQVKAEKALAEMVLVKNARLSVQPVTAAQWKKICTMAGLKP